MMEIEISFIVTVFNKEQYLPAMISSILRQTNNIACEYIFVDDLSTDGSVEIIKNMFTNKENLTIITNKDNVGPSIRLNQGCKASSGKYLFLIDADDILAQNSLNIMLNAIKSENADFVFGVQKIMDQSQESLLDIKIPNDCTYKTSTNPLETILAGKYVRMAYLTTKELYLKSDGADERIFIQDESLPLRLGYHAKKMVTLDSPAVYGAKITHSLSCNKLQQIHDRFYAYYFSISEFSAINSREKSGLYKRAISCVWKAKKIKANFLEKLIFFTFYLLTKFYPIGASSNKLHKFKKFIDGLENVRKIP